MEPIGTSVRRLVSSTSLEEGLAARRAITLWPEIAGENLAKVCEAQSLFEGVLFVRAKSSSWTNELTFIKPELLRKISNRIGAGLIRDIRFTTGSRDKKSESVNSVRDKNKDGKFNGGATHFKSLDLGLVSDPKQRLKLLIDHTEEIGKARRDRGYVECSQCRSLFLPAKKNGNQSNPVCDLCLFNI
jgi:hypothetical protein